MNEHHEWYRWFAWYPVRVLDKIVWLQTVEKRRSYGATFATHYRLAHDALNAANP